MEYPKFKRGDIVKANGSIGKVLGSYRDEYRKLRYKVEYESVQHSKDVTEGEMTFFHEDFQDICVKKVGSIGDICPRCKTPWTVTGFGATKWKDCVVCKRKAEDIVGSTSDTSKPEDEDDLLSEFELMIGNLTPDWFDIS